MSRTPALIMTLVSIFAVSCGERTEIQSVEESSSSTATTAPDGDSDLPRKELAPGLYAVDIKTGKGKKAKRGSVVKVHATGRLTNGKVFWTSYTKGQPIDFRLQSGAVIDGWVEGVPGMREGGHRKLTIPYRMAYGDRGRPGSIPPRSDLIFDIELIKVVQ